jgi:hypothetical protein
LGDQRRADQRSRQDEANASQAGVVGQGSEVRCFHNGSDSWVF